MPSRFSVKMRTRRLFHLGGGALRRLAEGRQVRAEVLADPVDEAPRLGVGQVPRLLGDLLHLVEERLLSAPERLRPRHLGATRPPPPR